MCCDYDNCKIGVKKNCDLEIVYFGFSCFNFKQIFDYGGVYFLNKYYKGGLIF